MTAGEVLLVDDEPRVRLASRQTLELAGYEVHDYESAEQALEHLDPDWRGVVVSDVRMPGIDGLELLRRCTGFDADLPVILITGHGDVEMAVQAMRDGAYDFIEKPFAAERLVETVRRAFEKRNLVLENRSLRSELAGQTDIARRIIGRTSVVDHLRATVANLADTEANVLLRGETGTGKELVARCLHQHGGRRAQRFVAINCGALPEGIIESELFGHEAGAFTGATHRRIGKFEHADGGTVFLDEIESMPLSLQVRLLRVLQERTIERLGSNESVAVDVRVIAATKTDLKALAAAGKFREDLYYRLAVIEIRLPALRERGADIPMLFRHFTLLAAARYHREPAPIEPERMRRLMSAAWPGNVRELQNAAERFVLGDLGDLGESRAAPQLPSPAASLSAQVDLFEKSIIEQELARHHGSVKATYTALGLPRKTLYDKMRKYGIERNAFIDP